MMGTYGFRCAYSCNCPSPSCDAVHGCNDTDCYPGWSGPTCMKRNILVNLTLLEKVSNKTDTASSVCTVTKNTSGDYTWWQVDLLNVTSVSDVIIDLRANNTVGLNGTQVQLKNTSNSSVSGDNCHVTELPEILRASCANHGRFILVNTSSKNDEPNNSTHMMVVCQVEANVCAPGTFGNDCSNYCHCAEGVCNYTNGDCRTNVCQPGWQGSTCSQHCGNGTYGVNCSSQCENRNCTGDNSTCDPVTGECVGGCNPGWNGTSCTQRCETDMEYGVGCARNCNARMCKMNSSCSVETGHCDGGCEPGWKSDDCYERCGFKTYGLNCTGKCGQCGNNTTCDYITGTCTSCAAGWTGDFCNETCKNGTYGKNCEERCGMCMGGECNHVTGTCTEGCLTGYTGDRCMTVAGPSQDRVIIIAAAAGGGGGVLVVVLIAVGICLRRRRKRKNPHPTSNGYTTVSSEKAPEDVPPVVYTNVAFKNGEVELDDLVKEVVVEQGDAAPDSVDDVDEVVGVGVVEAEVEDAEVEDLEGDVDEQEMEEPEEESTYYNLESPLVNTELEVDQLGDRIRKIQATKYGFQKEFRVLFVGFTRPYGESQQEGQQGKNRFQSYCPYDYNRVLLSKSPEDPHSHYINASYIDGFTRKKAYIAAQAPNDQTLHDFWRMIWEINCSRIVMLTNLVETGKVKCVPYWLDKSDLDAGLFTISVTNTCCRSHWVIRDLEAKSKETGNSRHFRQFHFVAWPDHGTPDSTALTEFLWLVRETPNPQDSPLLVHCSAGIGRTGTYIALDYLLDRVVSDQKVDVFGFVSQMRDQRKGMVQTREQYAFIYTTLHQALTYGNTAMDPSDFSHKRTTDKTFPMGSMDIRLFLEHTNQERRVASSAKETKGRIWLDGKTELWAVLSPSWLRARGYVVMEVPSTATAPVFWRLAADQGSTTVVTILLNFKNVGHFLPNAGNNVDLDPVKVSCSAETNVNPDITCRNFKLETRGSSRPTSVQVYLMRPLSTVTHSSLLELMEAIDLSAGGDNSHPVTVVFSEATRLQAVLFCILNTIIQGVKHDSTVEIYNNIRSMAHLLQDDLTTEDVQLCFDVAAAYLEPEGVYANL
ncbi:receptor-type tyrosine-protein phosphatase epsilon-like isoform X2 [Haliotis asinina]